MVALVSVSVFMWISDFRLCEYLLELRNAIEILEICNLMLQ